MGVRVGPKVMGLVRGREKYFVLIEWIARFTIPRSVTIYGLKVGQGSSLRLGGYQQLTKSGRV